MPKKHSEKNAFVIIHFGNNPVYLELELYFFKMLRKHTKYDIIYLYSITDTPPSFVDAVSQFVEKVVPYNDNGITYNVSFESGYSNFNTLRTCNFIFAYTLEEYDNICIIESDMVIMKNIDYIFEVNKPAILTYYVGDKYLNKNIEVENNPNEVIEKCNTMGRLNGGVMLFKPSMALFETYRKKIKDVVENKCKYPNETLFEYVNNKYYNLPVRYNLSKHHARESRISRYGLTVSDIVVYHFNETKYKHIDIIKDPIDETGENWLEKIQVDPKYSVQKIPVLYYKNEIYDKSPEIKAIMENISSALPKELPKALPKELPKPLPKASAIEDTEIEALTNAFPNALKWKTRIDELIGRISKINDLKELQTFHKKYIYPIFMMSKDDDSIRIYAETLQKVYQKRMEKIIEPKETSPTMEGAKIAIIVPFRDSEITKPRTAQLVKFVTYMKTYLSGYNYKIFIIEQSEDGLKFNRGQLLNIGFFLAEKEGYENFIFHDVDLLPSEELKKYYINVPTTSPVHIASVWDRYGSNQKYFGGIVAFGKELFEKINGYPNNFWGWGGEDDELYNRTKKFSKIIKASEGSITDLENLDLKDKLKYLKENDLKFMKKYEALDEHEATWQTNGLNEIPGNINIIKKDSCGSNCSLIRVKLVIDITDIYGDELLNKTFQELDVETKKQLLEDFPFSKRDSKAIHVGVLKNIADPEIRTVMKSLTEREKEFLQDKNIRDKYLFARSKLQENKKNEEKQMKLALEEAKKMDLKLANKAQIKPFVAPEIRNIPLGKENSSKTKCKKGTFMSRKTQKCEPTKEKDKIPLKIDIENWLEPIVFDIKKWQQKEPIPNEPSSKAKTPSPKEKTPSPKEKTSSKPRCPKGTVRNKKTGKCEPKIKEQAKEIEIEEKRLSPPPSEKRLSPPPSEKRVSPPLEIPQQEIIKPKGRCPNGMVRNKKTGECEPKKK